MTEVTSSLLTMTTIILICIGLTMMGAGLYQKSTVSICIRETSGAFVLLGLILFSIPQTALYGICYRSKRLFFTFFYAMIVVTLVVSSYSIKSTVYNITFGIAKNPSKDHRTVHELLGKLVSPQKFRRVTECIIHNHDCNFNASKNSNVWTFCCAQPRGCGDLTMFEKPGEWSWKHQYVADKIPEGCKYDYCLSCKGCQLSILKAIVQQWKYLSMFTYPTLILCCICLGITWFLKETLDKTEDYRGSYS